MTHSNEQQVRKGRHCVSVLHAHLVFVTKYRRKVFNDDMLNRLKVILEETCQDFEVNLTEFNGETDHVHLLVEYPPKVQLSKLINSLMHVSEQSEHRFRLKAITHFGLNRSLIPRLSDHF